MNKQEFDNIGGRCESINETIYSLATRPWLCNIHVEHYVPLSSLEKFGPRTEMPLSFTYRWTKAKTWLETIPRIQVIIHDTVRNYDWTRRQPDSYILSFIFELKTWNDTAAKEVTATHTHVTQSLSIFLDWARTSSTYLKGNQLSGTEDFWSFSGSYIGEALKLCRILSTFMSTLSSGQYILGEDMLVLAYSQIFQGLMRNFTYTIDD